MIRNRRDWEDDREFFAADDERDTPEYRFAFVPQYHCRWCGTLLERGEQDYCGHYCQDMARDLGQESTYSKL